MQLFHEFLAGEYESLLQAFECLRVLHPDFRINRDLAMWVYRTHNFLQLIQLAKPCNASANSVYGQAPIGT